MTIREYRIVETHGVFTIQSLEETTSGPFWNRQSKRKWMSLNIFGLPHELMRRFPAPSLTFSRKKAAKRWVKEERRGLIIHTDSRNSK